MNVFNINFDAFRLLFIWWLVYRKGVRYSLFIQMNLCSNKRHLNQFDVFLANYLDLSISSMRRTQNVKQTWAESNLWIAEASFCYKNLVFVSVFHQFVGSYFVIRLQTNPKKKVSWFEYSVNDVHEKMAKWTSFQQSLSVIAIDKWRVCVLCMCVLITLFFIQNSEIPILLMIDSHAYIINT